MKRMFDLNVGESQVITGNVIGPGYVMIDEEEYFAMSNVDLEEPEPDENVNECDLYYERTENGEGKLFKMIEDAGTPDDPYLPFTIKVERIR